MNGHLIALGVLLFFVCILVASPRHTLHVALDLPKRLKKKKRRAVTRSADSSSTNRPRCDDDVQEGDEHVGDDADPSLREEQCDVGHHRP